MSEAGLAPPILAELAFSHTQIRLRHFHIPSPPQSGRLGYFATPITPQAMRPPALPVGCVVKSSALACKITA